MSQSASLTQLLLVAVGLAGGIGAARRCCKPQARATVRDRVGALALRALPVAVFCAAARFDHARHGAKEIVLNAALVVIVFALCAATAALLAWTLRCDRAQTAALALASGCGSTGMLGLPATDMLHGSDALPIATIRDQANFALLALAMPAAACWARGAEHSLRQTMHRAAAAALRFPPLLAMAGGLFVAAVAQPAVQHLSVALQATGSIALAVVCAAGGVLVGLCADRDVLEHQRPALGVGLGVKLVVAPALTLAACHAFGLGAEPVTQLAMPTLLAVAMLSERERLQPQLVATLAMLGTLAAPVTVPLVHGIAQRVL
jgi:predicted permease